MPLAAQLFASSNARAASQVNKRNTDPSSVFASTDQSFSDALQAASQSSNSASKQPAPPAPSSTPSTDDNTKTKADASSDSAAHDTSTSDPSSADATPNESSPPPPATDTPLEDTPKTPGKTKVAEASPSAAPDLATQAALTTLLPTHIPLPKPQAAKPIVSIDATPLPAASQSPLKPQPVTAKLAKNTVSPADSQKTPTLSKSPAITAETATASEIPAVVPPVENLPAASDTPNIPGKDPLATKSDSTLIAKPGAPAPSQTAAPDAAAIAATSPDLIPTTKPTLATIDAPNSPTDPSAASLAVNSAVPLSSHTAHAQSASPAQDLPRTDPAQTYDQIVLGLRTKLDANNQTAEIHLNPPNLGSLHVSIQLANGSLTASFNSQSEVVRDLLKSNMDKLKSVLQDQGIAVDKLNVNTIANSSQSSPDRNPNSGTGSAPHDGRSAGYSQQNPSNQNRSAKDPNANTFARAWKNATKDAAPIDLVA